VKGLTFSAEQVKAIRAGTMTETRRIIAVEPWDSERRGRRMEIEVGDELNVYEPYLFLGCETISHEGQSYAISDDIVLFEADDLDSVDKIPEDARSTAFQMAEEEADMEHSRIGLRVTGVEVIKKLGCVELDGVGNEYALVAIKFEVTYGTLEENS
jgi:hypothetical protein